MTVTFLSNCLNRYHVHFQIQTINQCFFLCIYERLPLVLFILIIGFSKATCHRMYNYKMNKTTYVQYVNCIHYVMSVVFNDNLQSKIITAHCSATINAGKRTLIRAVQSFVQCSQFTIL